MRFWGTKDIKFSVELSLRKMAPLLSGKRIVDLPAGSGVSSQILADIGADVRPYDLFPSFFNVAGLQCQYADLSERLPIAAENVDVVLCQEGIEHVPDQYFMLKEFNRILRMDGILLLTTPNYSNLRARMSYFLLESEYYRIMPPNVVDSVWYADNTAANSEGGRLYLGHIFLVGIQKLNVLAKLSGFELREILPVRVNYASLLIFLWTYPFLVLRSLLTYWRAIRKCEKADRHEKRRIYWDLVAHNLNPRVLLGGHLFLKFEKTQPATIVESTLRGIHKNSGFQT